MALGIQVFGGLFGLFIVYFTFVLYKRKDLTFNEFGFWALFGVLFGVISLFPRLLDPVVATLSIGRKMDLFIILGFMFLILTVFYVYHVTRRNQKQLEELVTNIALKKK